MPELSNTYADTLLERRITKIPRRSGTQGKPWESRQKMKERIMAKKNGGVEWEKICLWARARQEDLIDFEGMGRKDAYKRSWVEASWMNPPPKNKIVVRPPVRATVEGEYREAAKQREKYLQHNLAQNKIREHLMEELPAEEVPVLDPRKQPNKEVFDVPEMSPRNPIEVLTDEETKAMTEADAESFIRDAIFAWQYMEVRVKRKDVPSPGAWSLLMWARENPDNFFQNLIPRVLSSNDRLAKMRAERDVQIEKMRLEMKAAELEANKMSREEVRAAAQALDFCQAFGLNAKELTADMNVSLKEPPPEIAKDLGLHAD